MEPDVSALFLGLASENQMFFQEMLDLATEDYLGWGRADRVSDDLVMESEPRRGPLHGSTLASIEEALTELCARLRDGTHVGRSGCVRPDTLMAANLGHIASILHAPFAVDATLNREVDRHLIHLLGYDLERASVTVTKGRMIANQKGLWLARNLRALAEIPVSLWRELLPDHEVGNRVNPTVVERLKLIGAAELQGRLSELREAGQDHQSGAAKLLVPGSQLKFWRRTADLLGIRNRDLVGVPVGSDFRLNVAALRDTLEEMVKSETPILGVVAMAGSSSLGLVDPIHEILDVRSDLVGRYGAGFYIHVDATYGGYIRSTFLNKCSGFEAPEGLKQWPMETFQQVFKALPGADSVAVAPNPGDYIPDLVGALAVKDRRAWWSCEEEETSEHSQRSVSPEVASLWMAHQTLPLTNEGYGRLLTQGLNRNRRLYQALQEQPNIEVGGHEFRLEPLVEPELSVVTFLLFEEGSRELSDLKHLGKFIQECCTRDPHQSNSEKTLLSCTVLEYDHYAPALDDLGERLGFEQDQWREQKSLVVLKTCMMNPYLSYEEYFESFREAIWSTVERYLHGYIAGFETV